MENHAGASGGPVGFRWFGVWDPWVSKSTHPNPRLGCSKGRNHDSPACEGSAFGTHIVPHGSRSLPGSSGLHSESTPRRSRSPRNSQPPGLAQSQPLPTSDLPTFLFVAFRACGGFRRLARSARTPRRRGRQPRQARSRRRSARRAASGPKAPATSRTSPWVVT